MVALITMSCCLVEKWKTSVVLWELPPHPACSAALPPEAQLSSRRLVHASALDLVARHPLHGIPAGGPL